MMAATRGRRGPMLALLALGAVEMGASACRGPIVADQVLGVLAPDKPRVVLLRSAQNHLATLVTDAFLRDANYPVAVYTLGAEANPRSLELVLQALEPTILVTLGGEAMGFARSYFPNVPTVFALVMNDQASVLAHNISGIALDLPPFTEFSMYKMVLPRMRRVMTFYAPKKSKALIAQAERELKQLDIQLLAYPIHQASEIPGLFKEHAAEADAVWLLTDPLVMSEDTFEFLRDEATAAHLPFLCSTFEDFAYHGALMSVSVDFANVGAQAASLVQLIADDTQRSDATGVISPIGGRLVVNQAVADRIGVVIPPRIKPFISRLIMASE